MANSSILTAIVGILLGNLLIATLFAPALKKLHEILRKFAAIQLPFENRWSTERLTSDQRRKAEDLATLEFNRLFREYEMSFNPFKKVGGVFVAAIILLACAVAWQMPTSATLRIMWAIILVGAIVGAGYYLQRAIAPTSSQLVSIDFLQNNFANLHLDALFDCSHLHISFGRGLGTHDPVMHFTISKKLMFLGYRFLLAVSDQECSRVYFVANGQLDVGLNFQQLWTPDITSFSIPVGDFSLSDAIMSCNSLRLHLWLFIPTPKGWIKGKSLHPRFFVDDLTEDMGGRTGIRLYSGDCHWGFVDDNVDFEQSSIAGFESWKITRLVVPDANSPQAILHMFKEKIERCKGVESEDYPSGINVRKVSPL